MFYLCLKIRHIKARTLAASAKNVTMFYLYEKNYKRTRHTLWARVHVHGLCPSSQGRFWHMSHM
jgi:hypothetical protein